MEWHPKVLEERCRFTPSWKFKVRGEMEHDRLRFLAVFLLSFIRWTGKMLQSRKLYEYSGMVLEDFFLSEVRINLSDNFNTLTCQSNLTSITFINSKLFIMLVRWESVGRDCKLNAFQKGQSERLLKLERTLLNYTIEESSQRRCIQPLANWQQPR